MSRITHLDGLPQGPLADAVRRAVPDSVHHPLGAEIYAPCRGCFECWTKTPGRCSMRDAANDLMEDAIRADVLLITVKVRFGTWHPLTKAALDRMIALLSPFFQERGGETHHRKRYGAYPHWAVLGVVEPGTSRGELDTFVESVRRAAVDMHSAAPWVGFIPEDTPPSKVGAIVTGGLAELEDPAPFPKWTADWPDPQPLPEADTPRHALLWVGSAKPPGESASEVLGTHLLSQLEAAGWTHETLHARRAAKLGRGRAPRLVEAVQRADLVVLATPVYVDTLPALVLEGLSDLRGEALGATALLPIVQCGFPETLHTETTLSALGWASRSLGMTWAGHLAVGGGGIVSGHGVAEHGPTHAQWEGLREAAGALSAGGSVPVSATARFGEEPLGPATYRALGHAGWLAQAWKHGSLLKLWDRPFGR